MEGDPSAPMVLDGSIRRIKLSLATEEEICTYSINECPISHPSQLGNPFLGLPLETGKCESCGTAENGKCEGHFGFIELPVPVYHPCHVSELRQILSLICLKCLRLKKGKVKQNQARENVSATSCYYCRDLPALSIKEVKTTDGALRLELRAPSRKQLREGFWNFLDQFGFHYGDSHCRPLLPLEALNILKKIPEETRRKLAAKGYIPQAGYVMKHLPVPPNCLYVPEISDGKTIMSYDISITLLRKVLHRIEQIKKSRAGSPNFESHEVESSDLQVSIAQYMHLRGTTRGPQDITKRFAIATEANELSTKQWLEKMRTLFISKGSGFSSRSVITGDSYIGINVVGLPSEVAKRITFEEQVTDHNISRLQEVVDKGLCLTYRDGPITYAISVGSKGHTVLKVGQTINRRIVDGDVVFLNRPPSTHKHSLQAFYVYIHDDHTVKINPLICAPLGADFDGDCVHIFYPQSLAAKAEALELFSVEKQLTSSHSGNLNLQIVHDCLLALKLMSCKTVLRKETAHQLAMFVSFLLPPPAVVRSGTYWTINQVLQGALPTSLYSHGDKHMVQDSGIIRLDLDRESVQAAFTEIISSILSLKGPREALEFLNVLQPVLMEFLLLDGFSISLKDFDVPKVVLKEVQRSIQRQSFILERSRGSQNQFVELRVENNLKSIKQPIVDFVVNFSALGLLIDPKSDSAIAKVVQQLGFLGLQLYRQGKFYSSTLVEDCFTNFVNKHPSSDDEHPSEAYGLVKGSFYHGLNPYEELVHAISSRETIVRSSRGLTEPGTLFKSLMAILRDVVICYDGTVRNICSNAIMQFEYMEADRADFPSVITPGEPVGVLAATAISNPAYKAVLDSSQSNNTSWELMKEILLTKVSYKNDTKDRKVILFLNDCFCGKKFCKEKAAIAVQGCLKKVKLEDCTTDISIEYQKQITIDENSEATSTLVGHIHLDKAQLELINVSIEDILQKCQELTDRCGKKKGHLSLLFKKIILTSSECSFTQKPNDGKFSKVPCLQFSFSDSNTAISESVEKAVHVLADIVSSVLLDTIIKGDPRIQEAKIIWVGADATSWVKNTRKASKGEPAVEIVVEKDEALHNGDAWRTTMDACLPVLNLIDTRRSIPYGVQQVRELLGISCAFDQVVQRLSTTIRMVAKGVLKDHLILVANSMTCTGNLNGFNSGGYKATFRSLKVQVPFTESTLFTPMRCFERAAEKCHADSLGCVVSSCSWGKHAAIGTGSAFQILWDEKQLENNREYGDGLYDFLALVRTTAGQEKANYLYLDDVEYLEEENEVDDMCLSPEFDGGLGKPTFEENLEAEGDHGDWNSSWDKPSNAGTDSDNWGGWGNGVAVAKSGEQALSEKSKDDNNSSWDKPSSAGTDSDNGGGWGGVVVVKPGEQALLEKSKSNNNSSWDKPASAGTDSNNWGGWGNGEQADTRKSRAMAANSGEPAELGNERLSDVWSDWGAGQEQHRSVEPDKSTQDIDEHSSWDKANVNRETQLQESDPWNKKKTDGGPNSWKKPNAWKNKHSDANQDSWGNVAKSSSRTWRNGEQTDTNNSRKMTVNSGESAEWGNNRLATAKSDAWSDWGTNQGHPVEAEKSAMEIGQDSAWGKTNFEKQTQLSGSDPWSERKSDSSKSSWEQPNAWSSKNSDANQDSSGQVAASQSNQAWSANQSSKSNQESDVSQWNVNPSSKSSAWDDQNSVAEGSSNANRWNESKDSNSGKQPWKSDGWGSKSGAWRGQKNNSGRPPRKPDERGPPRRREPMTTEEEKILVEVEPVMQSIKKIVRESSDGVRLSPEDEKFITDNVLEHHPEKQSKVSGEIDYITVAKHEVYQESRCLYVVSSDGSRADFSYIKCMENFVRKSFPDHGDSFCRKYFRKSRREPTPTTPTVDEAATPLVGTPVAETPSGTPQLE